MYTESSRILTFKSLIPFVELNKCRCSQHISSPLFTTLTFIWDTPETDEAHTSRCRGFLTYESCILHLPTPTYFSASLVWKVEIVQTAARDSIFVEKMAVPVLHF